MLLSLKASEKGGKLSVAVTVPGERGTVLKVCELQRMLSSLMAMRALFYFSLNFLFYLLFFYFIYFKCFEVFPLAVSFHSLILSEINF